MKAYNVYLNNVLVDTVYYIDMDSDEVKRSLVEHDGYDSRIVVKVQKWVLIWFFFNWLLNPVRYNGGVQPITLLGFYNVECFDT